MSVTNSLGCGQRKGCHESYSGFGLEVKLLKKVRLEIAVNEDSVKRMLKATIAGPQNGQIGDGKTFVLDLAECIRVRTWETGGTAI